MDSPEIIASDVVGRPAFPHARLLTRLSYAAMMSLSIGMNLLPVFLTTLSRLYGGEAGLTQEQLGRLGAFVFGGLVLGILATGPLADRLGAKLFAVLGNALIAVSLVGMALAPGYVELGVAFFFLGLGAGILDMILSPVVAALNPGNRSVSMNLLHSFYCVGAAVTILVGTLALSFGLGWAAACFMLIPLPLVLLGPSHCCASRRWWRTACACRCGSCSRAAGSGWRWWRFSSAGRPSWAWPSGCPPTRRLLWATPRRSAGCACCCFRWPRINLQNNHIAPQFSPFAPYCLIFGSSILLGK